MDVILSPVEWKFAPVYLDNIVEFSRSPLDHIIHVKHVLSLLREARVTLKLRSVTSPQKPVDYLGHFIRPRRLETATHTAAAIKRLKPSTNITELCSFVGLCNVFRRFVHHLAPIEDLLNIKLMKD